MAFPTGLAFGGRLHAHGNPSTLPAVFDRQRGTKPADQVLVALERGRDGYVGSWCLDLPGCYALVPPGSDPIERSTMAILEFASWSHQRSAERFALEPGQVVVAESVSSDADLRAGDTVAFFPHDAEPPRPNEFPLWATPHDTALDELRELAKSIPPAMQDHRLDSSGRTVLQEIEHVAETERFYASRLRPAEARPPRAAGRDPGFRDLQDAHVSLQQVVCDVAPGTRSSLPSEPAGQVELWSVRKVMRRSIWHLRYHTWELRRAIGSIWLS